ncbi:MAG: BlaI/MecI/CopY family transcriptional regulator [Candidatus Zixiibacteriota bacterium]
MAKRLFDRLSKRERQIMDVIFREGEATVAQVQNAIPDPPSYSSVRALLGVLEDKGIVKHAKRGRTYVYMPTVSRDKARRSALTHVVDTFFDGSVESVVAALVHSSAAKVSDDELERLEKLIREKREKG